MPSTTPAPSTSGSSTAASLPAASSARTGAARRILHPGSAGMLLGGLLIVVGSLLPWVSTPVGSMSGMAGPGLWTLCAGTIAIAGALLPYRWVAIGHAAVAGIVVAAFTLWQVGRLVQLSALTDSWGRLLPGIGLVMAAGGAVILLRTALRLRSAG